MSNVKQPRNPSLETLDCLDARLIELDLLEQAMNAGRDLTTFKLQRLEDLQNRRAKLQAGHQAEAKPVDGEHGKLPTPLVDGELSKYAIKAWVPTDGDLNGKQVVMDVVQLDIANAHLQAAVQAERAKYEEDIHRFCSRCHELCSHAPGYYGKCTDHGYLSEEDTILCTISDMERLQQLKQERA